MNNFLLGFPNKRERDDFLIAMVVLFFFFWLMYHFVFCNKEIAVLPEAEPAVAAVVEDNFNKDRDGDGVYDRRDKCPDLAGVKANDGCPADADGDGVYDVDDKCPKEKGTASNDGCPSDKDGDGIADKNDNCPEVAGVKANDGCPADADGDGVYDVDDKCPNKKGKAENGGCPEVKIEEAEAAILRRAMQAVEFETGSASLKSNSARVLNEIQTILQKYPRYKIDIIGHTDNQGEDAANLQLSKDRARTCYDYFVKNGVAARRIQHTGYGEARPQESNDTPQGRKKNRRVEFNLHY